MTRTTGTVPAIPVPAPADDGTPVAATDLAALEAERDEKRRRLERAARAALEGASGLPPGCGADDVPALLRRYYWSEPAAEVLDHDPADLAALAMRHLRLAEVRPQGSATVDVQELPARDGAGPRALVLLVTDDMPFLVDSVTAEVVRQGFGLEHVVHPVLVVRRDVTGRIRAFCDSADPDVCGADALAESWMAVLLDGPLDEEATGDLVAGLRTVLADVRAVHEDAARMRTRALELADRLGRAAVPPETAADPADDPAEAAALLRWLTDGNFVFLGARDVDLVPADGRTTARPVAGSGLGVLRGDADIATAPESAPGTTLLAVTKADARSPRAPGPRRAGGAPRGGGGGRAPRRPRRQPHRQGAARRPGDLPPRRALPGRHRRAAAGRARRAAPAGAPADPAVPAPRPRGPVLVGDRLPAPRPVHDRGAAGGAAAAARAPGRPQHRVHRPGHRVGARPAALRRPPAGDAGRTAHAARGRRPRAAGRAGRRRPQLDRRAGRGPGRPLRRGRRAPVRPRRRRLPGRLPGGLPGHGRRRGPRAARRAGRGGARAGAAAPRGGVGGRAAAGGLPGGAAAAALRRAADAAAPGRGRRRRAALRDRPDRRPAGLDLRLRADRAGRRPALPRLAARALHRGAVGGVARRRRGRRPGRAGAAGRTELAAGDRRPRVRAVAAAGRPALRPAVRGDDAGRPPRRRRPAGGAVRDPLLPGPGRRAGGAHRRAGPVAARGDRPRGVAGRRPGAHRAAGRRPGHPADHLLRHVRPPPHPARAQAAPRRGPRRARAAAGPRGVGELAAGDGRAPALRRGRPRRAALVRPARGPAHRGARAGQGADGEEHRHRADRGQGRLRRPPAPGGERGPGRVDRRGAGLLPAVHRRAAVPDRQPGL